MKHIHLICFLFYSLFALGQSKQNRSKTWVVDGSYESGTFESRRPTRFLPSPNRPQSIAFAHLFKGQIGLQFQSKTLNQAKYEIGFSTLLYHETDVTHFYPNRIATNKEYIVRIAPYGKYYFIKGHQKIYLSTAIFCAFSDNFVSTFPEISKTEFKGKLEIGLATFFENATLFEMGIWFTHPLQNPAFSYIYSYTSIGATLKLNGLLSGQKVNWGQFNLQKIYFSNQYTYWRLAIKKSGWRGLDDFKMEVFWHKPLEDGFFVDTQIEGQFYDVYNKDNTPLVEYLMLGTTLNKRFFLSEKSASIRSFIGLKSYLIEGYKNNPNFRNAPYKGDFNDFRVEYGVLGEYFFNDRCLISGGISHLFWRHRPDEVQKRLVHHLNFLGEIEYFYTPNLSIAGLWKIAPFRFYHNVNDKNGIIDFSERYSIKFRFYKSTKN